MIYEHGYGRYSRGCRCEVCRDAKAEYMRQRRLAASEVAAMQAGLGRLSRVSGITHGRYGYEERGCRCEVCVAAREARYTPVQTSEAA